MVGVVGMQPVEIAGLDMEVPDSEPVECTSMVIPDS